MSRAIALLLVALSFPARGQDAAVGGIGLLACREVVGPQNAPYLAQVGDWALGYLAGRLDAGQRPIEGTALSPGLAIDVVTGVAVRCREEPEMAVIDAVRDFASRIFDEPPQAVDAAPGVAAEVAPQAAPRPVRRPD